MRGKDIVNQFKKVLPLYTTDFSDEIAISTLSKSGDTVTITTQQSHGRNTNDIVVIEGAKEPITINSITRKDNIVTVACATKHKLPNPNKVQPSRIPSVEINGVNPSEYNGIYKLYATPDYFTFQYKIATTPAATASVNGFFLRNDAGDFAYNGMKVITKIDDLNFTYQVSQDLQSPAQGDIKLYTDLRIANTAGLELAESHYSANNKQILQNWLYVVVGDEETFRSGTTTTDIDSTQDVNEEFRYDSHTPFNLYIFLPAKDSSLVGIQADQARSYRKAILKTIANYLLPSELTEECLKPVNYQGNGVELLTEAYYVHRYSFGAKGEIVDADTVDATRVVPLKELDVDTPENVNIRIDFGN
jgi:hypothetical protein